MKKANKYLSTRSCFYWDCSQPVITSTQNTVRRELRLAWSLSISFLMIHNIFFLLNMFDLFFFSQIFVLSFVNRLKNFHDVTKHKRNVQIARDRIELNQSIEGDPTKRWSINGACKLTSSTWSNSLVSRNFSSSISSESRSIPSSSISASARKPNVKRSINEFKFLFGNIDKWKKFNVLFTTKEKNARGND